jgi:transposase
MPGGPRASVVCHPTRRIRWLVERFFAWIQWQRRILVRWEFYPKNFLGFVQLACLAVLFKRF